MTTLSCLAILLCIAPSLSLYLGQIIPQYYIPDVRPRSAILKPVPRSVIADPQLSGLLMARKQAMTIANDIDSTIEAILQDKTYRRTFDSQVYDSDGLPIFNPRPANTLSAVIGAQGGTWFPGPSGAGVEGSRMLEGRASQFSDRRTQDTQRAVERGQGPLASMLQRAVAIRGRYSGQMIREGQPEKQINARMFMPTRSQITPDPSDEISSK